MTKKDLQFSDQSKQGIDQQSLFTASYNCRTVQQHNNVTPRVTALHYNTFQCHSYTKVYENIVQNIPHYQIISLPAVCI